MSNFTFPVQENPLIKATIPYEATVSLGEELAAVWSTPQMSGLLGAEFTRFVRGQQGEDLPVEQLRAEYGGILDIEKPMTRGEVETLARNRRKDLIRQNILARGDSGGWGAAAKFGVALLDVATDPVELAVGFATAALFPATGGTFGARFARAAREAFVASTVTEAAYYGLSRRQQLDYTMNEALLNITLVTLLGGGIGAAFGPRIRGTRKDGSVLPTSREAELARVALNQFVNDEPVNFSPFLRDLRGSTSLTSVRGVEFQPEFVRSLDLPSTRAPVTMTQLGPDGTPMRFRSVQQAQEAADFAGGEVVRANGEITVRQPIEADFVRGPTGTPTTFPNRRAAEKFIGAAREGLLPEDARVVEIAPRQFAVAGNMTDEVAAAIEGGNSNLNIPRGVNTREIELVPNVDEAITAAARATMTRKGNAAYEDIAREYSDAALAKSETAIDTPKVENQEMSDAAEQIESFKLIVGDTIEEEAAIREAKEARIKGINETLACMIGRVA